MNFDRFRDILKDGQIRMNEPMSRHTTLGIGGAADCFLMPEGAGELLRVITAAKEEGIPFFILGGGANLLVRDKGIRGAVIATKGLRSLSRDGLSITAGAGVPTAAAARLAAEAGLSGLEFAGGIPGSIGGAVYMNAGAYGGETASLISSVTAVTEDGNIRRYSRSDLDYGYRKSPFMESGEIILEVILALEKGEKEEIKAKMAVYNKSRREKQPIDARSAGSTFKRPKDHFAGAMIEELGLKGFAVGDAAVSEKHAGFLINRGHATAADMLALIDAVTEKVASHYGIILEPEVQIVGEE